MKVKCNRFCPSNPTWDNTVVWIDIDKARMIYPYLDLTMTVIQFGPNDDDEITVRQSIEEINSQLSGGIHEH